MTVNTYGPLFSKQTKITPEIRRAAKKAAAYGLFRVKARSPVRTGEMRGGWDVDLEGYGIRFRNPVAHTIYNEMGTKYMRAAPMVRPTIPETQRVFKKELGKEIGRKLAGNVIGSLGGGIPSVSSPKDGAVFSALTTARSSAPKGRGFRGGYKQNFEFSFKGLKSYEREFGKARPARVGKLESKKARAVGAL